MIEYFFPWFIALLASYFYILYIYIHFSYKPDFLNNLVSLIAIYFIFIHILLFLLLLSLEVELHEIILPIMLLTLNGPFLLISILISLSTGFAYFYKRVSKKDLSDLGQKIEKKIKKNRSKLRKDVYRKINHVLIFVVLLSVWSLGVYIAKLYSGTTEGMIPEENNMLLLYFKILFKPNSIKQVLFNFGWFYYALFFFFYTLCLFILTNEFTRKSKNISFPFNIFSKFYLTEEEKRSYGTYLYFTIGHMFASFTCPPMVFFAILGMSSISDLMTSQIGIRFGKRHISWNQNKTWEGTIAGTIVSFIICSFFMGFYWSLIFSFVFLVFDVITNKPLNLSDNLLIPIGSSLVYLIIRFIFSFNYYSIILAWI